MKYRKIKITSLNMNWIDLHLRCVKVDNLRKPDTTFRPDRTKYEQADELREARGPTNNLGLSRSLVKHFLLENGESKCL